jgi:SAM-dependent methyltransferase
MKIKNILVKASPRLYSLVKALQLYFDKESHLCSSGFWRSWEAGRPVDRDGRPVPWMNDAVTAFLNRHLSKKMRVFEYGSGNSTHYFAKRVKKIVAVENEKRWFDYLKKRLPANAKVLYVKGKEPSDYCSNSIRGSGKKKYDVVIVDGLFRVKCAQSCLTMLKSDGVIVLDDSEKPAYQKAFRFLEKRAFKNLDLKTFKTCDIHSSQTTIFYRKNNCFNI